jgi:hypothetical protein
MGAVLVILVCIVVAAVSFWVVRSRKGTSAVPAARRTNADRPRPASGSDRLSASLDSIYIRNREHVADSAVSPNGRWSAKWPVSGPLDASSGSSADAPNVMEFACEGKATARITARAPAEVSVADNGTTVFCEQPVSAQLACRFVAANPGGEVLVTHRFSALPYKTAVSCDGVFAACQLLGSDMDTDSLKLALFDLSQKKLLWKKQPVAGPVEEIRLDVEKKVVQAEYSDGLVHRYGFDGQFLDKESWRRDYVMRLWGDQLLEAVEKEMARADATDRAVRIRMIDALKAGWGRTHSEHMAAKLLRRAGELHLELGDKVSALRCLEAALANDPKVGVNKKAARLREELGQTAAAAEQSGAEPAA